MTQARHQSNGGSPYSVVSPQSMQKSVSRVHLCLGPSPSALSHDLLQMVNNKACAGIYSLIILIVVLFAVFVERRNLNFVPPFHRSEVCG